MAKLDFDRIRKASQEMTDAELETALATQREDYVPEALEVMASELERRGVQPHEYVPKRQSESATLPWLAVYTAMWGIGSLIALISMHFSVSSLSTVACLFGVAKYLHKRAGWAWAVNMILLGVSTLGVFSGTLLGLIGSIWGISNLIYFYRIRHHFTE